MNDITAKENGKKALTIVTALTLFVAGFELFIAFTNYKIVQPVPPNDQCVSFCRLSNNSRAFL